jgi:sugar O-acyltransferase (sialic acid O-acetyltransferase NeuD family)
MAEMKKIAIYGFGGFGREIACLLNQINEVDPTWDIIGFFDDGIPKGTSNRYGQVLGGLVELNNWQTELNIVLAMAAPKHLKAVSAGITSPLISFPNIIAPNVNIFDKSAFVIGKGNLLFLGCRLSCDVRIGDFNIFNGAVSLGHDVKLGSFNVLGPSTRISGDCQVGDENFFGVNSTVLQRLIIGNKTRIGAGSIIMRNTKDGFLYLGNPAKKVIL